MTTMPRHQLVRYACNAETLCWVVRELRHLNVRSELALVVEVRELTADEYDAFAKRLLRAHDWLADFDGICNEALEVKAPGRTTLYVKPKGGNYARYVGLAAED